jgi:hypothetical protein
VRRAEEEGEMILKGQREGMGYEIKDAGIGAGRVTFVNGDFFHWAEGGLFDLIYDYTVSIAHSMLHFGLYICACTTPMES